MPDRNLPERPSLEQYKKQAKELLRDAVAGDAAALARAHKYHPLLRGTEVRRITLSDAQFVLAREHGYESWPKFAKYIETLRSIRAVEELDDPLNAFIEFACVDRHGSHNAGTVEYAELIRNRYLQNVPGNIFSDAVLGDAAAVRGHLARDRALATAKGGPHGWDALTYLCFSRYLRIDPARSESFVETARALLEAGASANTGWTEYIDDPPRPLKETAIYGAACIAQNAGMTKLLLEYGADPNDEETPYHVVETYDNSVLEILLDSGRFDEKSLATVAARKCDWHDDRGLQLALDHGANPNYMTIWKVTPFHHSIRRDNGLVMIEMLLDHGADPNLREGHHGQSGFEMAAFHGRGDILDSLERRGHEVKLDGLAGVMGACARGDLERAKALMSREKQLQEQLLAFGGTLLARFSGADNAAGVRCLLGLGILPAARWVEGDGYWELAPNSTALHVAAWRAHHEVVRTLIAAGTPVEAVDGRGRTALQLAVKACIDSYWKYRRRPDSVEALLAAGATTEGVELPTGYDAIDGLLAGAREKSG